MTPETLTPTDELAFPFLRANERPPKPRTRGVTEIRGPYYSVMGSRYLHDVLETMGTHIDALKFAGGSFTLMPERALAELIELCARARCARLHRRLHRARPHPGTGGRRPLPRRGARAWGLTSSRSRPGSSAFPPTTSLRLVERVQRAGLKAKPEVGIQFGAGGATTPQELEQEGTRDVGYAIDLARRCLDAGAYMVMIESEGITEEVTSWRTDVVATIARELGLEQVMFEAADPEVFAWYVKNYGPEVNLFVDHSQIVQLECLRRGIWGTKSLWGRVADLPRRLSRRWRSMSVPSGSTRKPSAVTAIGS